MGKWLRKNWKTILLIFLAIAFFAGNVCVLIFVKAPWQSAWLTLISGWVSGIATIVLGVIAVVQNKKHKEENDRYLKEQKKLNDLNLQEQKDLEWRRSKYEILQMTLNEYKNRQEEFQLLCDLKTNLTPIAFCTEKREAIKNFYTVTTKFHDASLKIVFTLKFSPQYFKWYENLHDIITDYTKKCLQLFDEIEEKAEEHADITKVIWEKVDTINDLDEQFNKINSTLPVYQLIIENDISDIYEKEINRLKLYYKNLTEQKQKWKEELKKSEEQNKGEN